MKYYYTGTRMKKTKYQQTIPSVDEETEHLEHSYMLVGLQYGTATLESSLAVSSKIKLTPTI